MYSIWVYYIECECIIVCGYVITCVYTNVHVKVCGCLCMYYVRACINVNACGSLYIYILYNILCVYQCTRICM